MAEWVTMGDGSQRAYADVVIDFSVDNDLSEALDLNEYMVTAIQMPDGFDGTNVGFKVSATSGGTYGDLSVDGTPVSIAFVASQVEVIEPKVGNAMYRYLKISSDGTETADRTFKVIGIKL